MHNFKEFLDYCESFYLPSHKDVLYPIEGLTREELALATLNYLDLCEEGTHVTWGGGDSLDRERVRDILVIKYGYDKTFYGGSVLWEDFENANQRKRTQH